MHGYKHDCDECKPIGMMGKYDIYVCPQNGYPTIVARFGDDGPEYESGPNLQLWGLNLQLKLQKMEAICNA